MFVKIGRYTLNTDDVVIIQHHGAAGAVVTLKTGFTLALLADEVTQLEQVLQKTPNGGSNA